MNILLANDDGIDAQGIIALEKALEKDATIYVVAPAGERSTTSHTLSLGRGLIIEKRSERKYSCSGYPADCVWMAFNHIFKNIEFDWVISGINRGANLAQDVFYSGTVAAAREACFHKVKSMAISMVLDNDQGEHVHFDSAGLIVSRILNDSDLSKTKEFEVINVNVPNLPFDNIVDIKRTHLGWRHHTKTVETRVINGETLYFIGGSYDSSSLNESEDTLATSNNYVSLTNLQMFLHR